MVLASNLVAVTAKYKLRVFQRIRKYLNPEKVKLLANAFSNTQFYYASMIWMFAGNRWYQNFKRYTTLHIVHEKSYEDLLLMNVLSLFIKIIYISSQQRPSSLSITWIMRNYFSVKSILYELRKGNAFFSKGIDLTRD